MQTKIAVSAFVLILSAAVLPQRSNSQQILSAEWGAHPMNKGPCFQSWGPVEFAVTITVNDWHPLGDGTVVQRLISQYPAEGMRRCPTGNAVSVYIRAPQSRDIVITAHWMRATGQWNITSNVRSLLQQEQREAQAREAAQAAQVQAQQQAQKREAERQRLLAAKEAAEKDCGATPSVSGGPWFSSTYKTGALDAVRQLGQFICVKTIEYVGPAVNPFGGNAARAKFIGYDNTNYKPYFELSDFPY